MFYISFSLLKLLHPDLNFAFDICYGTYKIRSCQINNIAINTFLLIHVPIYNFSIFAFVFYHIVYLLYDSNRLFLLWTPLQTVFSCKAHCRASLITIVNILLCLVINTLLTYKMLSVFINMIQLQFHQYNRCLLHMIT